MELGCKCDGWTEHFDPELWKQAFEDTGTNMDFYIYRERSYDEILPWDIIDPLDRDFLIKENEKARKGSRGDAGLPSGVSGMRYQQIYRML